MHALRLAAFAAIILAVAAPVDASERSKARRAEFVRTVPCPETGITRGPCPGWQVDHITPLCAGGADRAENMQWLPVADHKKKTRQDIRYCRSIGRWPMP